MTATMAEKNTALLAMAQAIVARRDEWLAANAEDMKAAKRAGMREALLDRLALDEKRINAIAEGVRQVAAPLRPRWAGGEFYPAAQRSADRTPPGAPGGSGYYL